jgi:hypothetical protein
MNHGVAAGMLALNLVAVALTSVVGVRRFYRQSLPEKFTLLVSMAVAGAAQVLAAVLLLGYLEILTPARWSLVHAGVCLVVLLACRREIPQWAEVRRLKERATNAVRGLSWFEWVLLSVVAVILAASFAAVLLGEPLVHDALSCGLSRVAYWLQEESIRHFPTNELRQNYRPFNADLLMLWFVGVFRRGYPLAALPQFFGGMLAIASAIGLARAQGFSRMAQWALLLFVLSMPNFTAQLSTSQSDLVTAGFFSAGLFLLRGSLVSKNWRCAVFAWIAIALAAGTKATIFFWVASFPLLVILWVTVFKADARAWLRHGTLAVIALGVFAAPRYVENRLNHGNFLGPQEAIALHDGARSGDWIARLGVNAASYLEQSIEPASNPILLRPVLRPVWQAFLPSFSASDPFAVGLYPRRASLERFGDGERNADTLSSGGIGVLLPLLGFLFAGLAWARKIPAPAAREVVFHGLAVLLYVIVFSLLFLWWPVNWRSFNVLVVPMALCAAYVIQAAKERAARVVTGLLALVTFCSAGETFAFAFNSGLATIVSRNPRGYLAVHAAQQMVANRLFKNGSRIGILLAAGPPLAGFFRGDAQARITFVEFASVARSQTAEEVLAAGKLDVLVISPESFTKPSGAASAAKVQSADGTILYVVYRPRSLRAGAGLSPAQ